MHIAFLPNLAGPDGILILVVVLLLFGAKRTPREFRGLGDVVKRFAENLRRAKQEGPECEAARIDRFMAFVDRFAIILLCFILAILGFALGRP